MADIGQKRISQLDKAVDPDQSVDIVTDIISSQEEADKWALPIDYVKPQDDPNPDRGTKQVPLTRVALLTKSGLVPASMLPSYISTVKRGKMEVSNGKWTFTEADTGNKYVCPDDPGQGEETPSVDCIYADIGSTSGSASTDDYYQYRFVPTGETGVGNTGHFVPIPSDLIVKDGDGTVVADDLSNYTRQIDISIGEPPSGVTDSNILKISSGKLVHTVSGVTAGSYPSTQTTAPGFGDTFNVPKITVNATGHVSEVTVGTVKVPDSPATTSGIGLVKLGTDIQAIGRANSAGTISPTSPERYVKVAAANHTHMASTLTLSNTNDGTKIYNGVSEVSYDFRNVLKAVLPSTAPSDGYILSVSSVSGASGLGAYAAEWVSPDSVIKPIYLFGAVGSGSIGTSSATMNLGSVSSSIGLSVSSNAITGIRANKTYMVSYNISIQVQSAGANLVDFSIGAKIGSGTVSVNKHVVDESIYGLTGSLFPQWVNGTIFVNAGDSGGNLTLQCNIPNITSGITWQYTGGTIQVAEVK